MKAKLDTYRPQGKKLTPEQQAEAKHLFLEAYARTGLVTDACRAAEINYSTYARWKENDAEFLVLFGEAQKQADDSIRKEIRRRALDGVAEPVFHRGEQVGSIRKYSDVLLIFLAKSRMPEFREKSQIEHTGTVSITDIIRKASEETPDKVEDKAAERV